MMFVIHEVLYWHERAHHAYGDALRHAEKLIYSLTHR